MTLRWRLTVAFVLVVLSPLLVGLLLVARTLPRAVQDRQQSDVTSSANLVAQVLRDYCLQAQSTAEAAGRAGTLTDKAGAVAVAQSLVSRGLADGIRVSGPTGPPLAEAGELPATALDCSEPATPLGGAYISAIVHLATGQGKAAGTSVAAFDVRKALLRRVGTAVGAPAVLLVSVDGQLVAGTQLVPTADLVAASHGERRTNGLVAAYVPPRAGQPFGIVVLDKAASGPGLLVTGGLIIAFAVLAAIGIAVASARSTTKPLAELGDAATRIAGGDLTTRIGVRSKDEVGRLAIAFNAMTDDLQGYIGQLQASRDELQSGLARLGDTLSSTHDLDRILNVVLESAMASTRASGGMVLLLTPERDVLSLAASKGLDVPVDLRLKVGEGISGRAAQSGDPIRGRVGRRPGQLRPAPGEPADESVIAVPLKSSGTVIGVLDLFGSPRPEGFDDSDLATIRTFASQATVAVDNVLLHEEAQRLSVTDALTGLPNYRYFLTAVAKEIERASRFSRPLALLMLDLDEFKAINDTFGHQRGDAVLAEVAQRVQRKVRDVDTVCRYGGEEFVVVLPETDEIGAAKLADRICSAIRRKPFGGAGVSAVPLTLSIGIAVFPDHGLTSGALLRKADDAMYAAKRAGRDTWRVSTVARGAGAPSD